LGAADLISQSSNSTATASEEWAEIIGDERTHKFSIFPACSLTYISIQLEKLEMNVSSLDDELLAVSPDAFFSDTDPDFLNSDENAQIIYTSTPPPATWPHRRQVDPAQHNALDKSTFESQQNINLK
jgi:hypothetical protein